MVDAPLLSKDGPLYIESLRLDGSYSVPMPGNIGYVVLGKLALQVLDDPIAAYVAVNLLLTVVGCGFVYLLACAWLPASMGLATVLALACNPMVWWHGVTINSYLVWLAVLPAVAWFGLRFVRSNSGWDLAACSLALGVGTILRQDLIAFGTPLWAGLLLAGRASPRRWLAAGLIVAACCGVWFAAMSEILGGPWEYLGRVQAKHAGHMEGFSPGHRGLFEGLARNAVKYGLFLAWSAPLVLLPFASQALRCLRRPIGCWRQITLATLWAGPSWAFALLVFAGNAGLLFPFLPVVYLGAASALVRWLRSEGARWPAAAMLLLGAVSAAQFAFSPLLKETDQRAVILNVTLLRYSGPGLLGRHDRNLDDYGIDPSLGSTLRQLRRPEPIPGRFRLYEDTFGPIGEGRP